jgi:nitrite reductase (NO-forming)
VTTGDHEDPLSDAPHGPADPPARVPESPAVDEHGRDRGHVDRRRFLRGAGLGAAALLGGGVAGATTARARDATSIGPVGPTIYDATAPGGTAPVPVGASPGATTHYGHGLVPPAGMPASHLDEVTVPPPPGTGDRVHTIDVLETTALVADGVEVEQWTYGGRAPGPILRATEGDRLRVTVRNRTAHDHNLHLHGRHHPGMDGWEPIPPGGEFTYDVVAAPAGLHPYHCHTSPLATHVARGLYGAMIVDPMPPRPEALEFVLVLSGWDVDGDGRVDVATFNGVAGFYHRHPIVVPVGELVRVYVLNMVEYEPVASFHLHAQTFDLYRTGTSTTPDEHTDTVTLGQGERAIVEFRLPEQGRYMFHPHQHHLAEAGAMGWFAAV